MRRLQVGDESLPVHDRTLVMGILNVTPDSFSGDGLAGDVEASVARGLKLVENGADIIDIGGESTRPGSGGVSAEEELARLEPVIQGLRRHVETPISVDTMKPEVAARALELGADILNDVNALRTPGMAEVAAQTGVPVILMHMLGTPRDMQIDPRYGDVVAEVTQFLAERVQAAVAAGVPEEQIIIDPGFGFGKTVEHNLELLRRLGELKALSRPILAGTSRKAAIGKVLGDVPPQERIWGTAATCAIAIMNGANIIRVHDVREMAQVARMTDAVVRGHDG